MNPLTEKQYIEALEATVDLLKERCHILSHSLMEGKDYSGYEAGIEIAKMHKRIEEYEL